MSFQKVSHRKVRTGCIQCKKRHVKVRMLQTNSLPACSLSVLCLYLPLSEQCDESKPKCRNCIRYPSECSFQRPAISQDASLSQIIRSLLQISLKPKPPVYLSDEPEFSFNDFKLLHHWTVSTAETLGSTEGLQYTMREVVPRVAIDHSYLM